MKRLALIAAAWAVACALPAAAQTVQPPDPAAIYQSSPCTGGRGEACVPIRTSDSSAAISSASSGSLQLVAASGSTQIYVTHFDLVANGTVNVKFVYGTGSNCATGSTDLTGAYPFTAQAGISVGNGLGTVIPVPAGKALCVNLSGAVQVSGLISYVQR